MRVLKLSGAKDPDEYIKKNGPERFKALLSGAVSDIEYKLLTAVGDIDTLSDDGRLRYLSKAAEIIACDDDVMTRDIYIGKMCEKYGVSRTAFTAKVEQLRSKNTRSKQKKEINNIIKPRFTNDDINPDRRKSPKAAAAEETLIAVLLQHPDLCETAKQRLPVEKMITGLNKRIYKLILDTIESGKLPEISNFAMELLPAELGYLVSLQNGDKALNNANLVLNDCINVILEEGIIINTADSKDLSIDDWANSLKNMIDKKTKGN